MYLHLFGKSGRLTWVIALVAAAAMAAPASAGVALSPLKHEISLKPGEEGKLAITVSNMVRVDRNEISASQPLHLEVADVQVSREGALEFPSAGSRPDSASKWIVLPQSDVTLDPGMAQTFDLRVRPPLSAPPGEYYCAVIISLKNTSKNDKGMVVQYRLASGVFVTVLGRTFPHQAKIESTNLVWPEVSPPVPGQPVPVAERPRLELVLANTGKSRFDASGKLIVIDQNSRVVFRTGFTSVRPNVFAGDRRLFEAALSRPLAAGKYTVRIDFDYQSPWAQAHESFPMEILPAQATQLALTAGPARIDSLPIEANPGKITSVMAPGSNRTFALAISNLSDDALACVATVDPGLFFVSLPPQPVPSAAGDQMPSKMPNNWIIMGSDPVSIPRASRRGIELRVEVPPGTSPGKYATSVLLDTGLPAFKDKPIMVPVEIEIKGGSR